jgi:hypothetical protein
MSRNSAVSQVAIALILVSLVVGGTTGYLVLQPTGNEPIGTGGITRVQGYYQGTSSTSASLPVTMTNTPIQGDLLVAVIATSDTTNYQTVSTITPTGVTWAKQVSQTNFYSMTSYYFDIEIWVGVVGAGAPTTITVTLTAAAGRGAVADVCEYSGLKTIGFLDKTATHPGSTDTGTTATTTQPTELWIGGVNSDPYAQTTSTNTNGFTLLDGAVHTAVSCAYLEKIVTTTGAAYSGTTTSSSYSPVGCIATFFSNAPPDAPSLISPAASWRFNPSSSVTFSWTFNDPDSGDYQTAYQFQLASDSGFSSLLINPGKTTDWRLGWSYYKSHVINVDSAAGTGYQVQIIANYGSGTDSGNMVYLNNHARSDFGDVRFTASDGVTFLSYWIQSYTSGASATFWVKITGDLSTSQTIYVYYGNSGAATTSSIANTFLFGDDFRLDTALDTSKWVLLGSPTVSFDSTNGLSMTKSGGASGGIKSVNAYDIGTQKGKEISEFRNDIQDGNYAGIFSCPTSTTGSPSSESNYVRNSVSEGSSTPTLSKRVATTRTTLYYGYYSATIFHQHILDIQTTATGYLRYFFDGAQLYLNAAELLYATALNYFYIYEATAGAYTKILITKYFALAKFVDPEPTQSAGGSETALTKQTTQALPSTVGIYYWHVKAWDSQGATGSYCAGRAVSVDRIKLTHCGILNNVIDTINGGKVWYQAEYESDHATFTGGNGTLSLSSAVMNCTSGLWTYDFPYQMSGGQTTFHVSSFTETAYGLNTLNPAAGDLVLNWATMTVTIHKP